MNPVLAEVDEAVGTHDFQVGAFGAEVVPKIDAKSFLDGGNVQGKMTDDLLYDIASQQIVVIEHDAAAYR